MHKIISHKNYLGEKIKRVISMYEMSVIKCYIFVQLIFSKLKIRPQTFKNIVALTKG